jgi:glyoxylase-like metal-dependent hydrolase (beta-lactamase superfamily II)
MTEGTPLTLDVFTVPSRPIIRPPRPRAPPDGWNWPPTAAVLIAGKREAVVVDTLVTTGDAAKLADWIEATGKKLTAIYVTHDHADHFLGAPVLLRRFPKSRLVALPMVIEEIRPQLMSGFIEKYWKPMFDGNVADGQVVPEPLDDGRVDIEGHEIFAVQTGQSDSAHSTYLHIPELAAIVAGDIAYNGVHMRLGNTDHDKRMAWIQTLRELAALQPRIVVAAHRRPEATNAPEILAECVDYILDFDRFLADGVGAKELIRRMVAAYPERINLSTLYTAAYMLSS